MVTLASIMEISNMKTEDLIHLKRKTKANRKHVTTCYAMWSLESQTY